MLSADPMPGAVTPLPALTIFSKQSNPMARSKAPTLGFVGFYAVILGVDAVMTPFHQPEALKSPPKNLPQPTTDHGSKSLDRHLNLRHFTGP